MIKQALKYMEKDPDKNLPKLLAWAEKIDTTGYFEKYIEYFIVLLFISDCSKPHMPRKDLSIIRKYEYLFMYRFFYFFK